MSGTGSAPFGDVPARLAEVRRRIAAAGGDAGHVRVVSVTKGLDYAAVVAARLAGCDEIGENYAGELVAKAARLQAESPDAPVRPRSSARARRARAR